MFEIEEDVRITDEVDLDDMNYDEKTGVYSFVCRCGDCYDIDNDELEAGAEIVHCGGCSLAIRVLYDTAE